MKPPSKLTQRDRLIYEAREEGKAEGTYVGLCKGVVFGVLLHKTLQGAKLEDALALIGPDELRALTHQSGALLGMLGK